MKDKYRTLSFRELPFFKGQTNNHGGRVQSVHLENGHFASVCKLTTARVNKIMMHV